VLPAALKLNSLVPAAVQAEVRDGFITLRGEVEYPYERTDVEEAVRYLPGVRGVVNEMTASDGTAHLYGHVHSIAEKRAATTAALNAPGIVAVDNHLEVVP
jgi:osmotically-inducible protein OsmY